MTGPRGAEPSRRSASARLTGYEDEAREHGTRVFTGYEDEAREHGTRAGRANDKGGGHTLDHSAGAAPAC
eukprot:1299977-Prymnesium_polylepis.1